METENPPPKDPKPEFDLDKIELDRPEPEEIPEDFILALFDFMEDVCRIESHVWAAEQALSDSRMIDEIRLRDEGIEAKLGRERAYHLMCSIAYTAEEAAKRAHKMWPKVGKYCEEQKIKRVPREEREDLEDEFE